ncbi:MAG: hypothetical protein WDN27_01750 [Candidatus Saccharibacteria bacterium]
MTLPEQSQTQPDVPPPHPDDVPTQEGEQAPITDQATGEHTIPVDTVSVATRGLIARVRAARADRADKKADKIEHEVAVTNHIHRVVNNRASESDLDTTTLSRRERKQSRKAIENAADAQYAREKADEKVSASMFTAKLSRSDRRKIKRAIDDMVSTGRITPNEALLHRARLGAGLRVVIGDKRFNPDAKRAIDDMVSTGRITPREAALQKDRIDSGLRVVIGDKQFDTDKKPIRPVERAGKKAGKAAVKSKLVIDTSESEQSAAQHRTRAQQLRTEAAEHQRRVQERKRRSAPLQEATAPINEPETHDDIPDVNVEATVQGLSDWQLEGLLANVNNLINDMNQSASGGDLSYDEKDAWMKRNLQQLFGYLLGDQFRTQDPWYVGSMITQELIRREDAAGTGSTT